MLRVIIDSFREPILNMAIDEAIFKYRRHVDFDTLRLYMWRPSGVSLGRAQEVKSTVNLDCIYRLGFQPVIRPTGGGALLHMEGGEVTYSVVLSSDHPISQMDIPASAVEIAKGVYRALEKLGLSVDISGEFRSKGEPLCYFRRGSSDILVNGRKISGSAQVRSGYSLLQHGTLLLKTIPSLWSCVIKEVDENVFRSQVTSLSELKVNYNVAKVYNALLQGFLETLDDRYFMGSLLPEEIEVIDELVKNKYEPWLSNLMT